MPESVSIAVTGKCNLKCRYCFYSNEMESLNDLNTQDWLAFIGELSKLAVMRVSLTGGEPFTRPDLFLIIDEIIKNRMRYSILSNGSLIDEKILDKFEIGKRRIRLDSVQISIDGSNENVHNKTRPGSFRAAIRGLRLLKDRGLPVTVRVTINRNNIDDLEKIGFLLLEDIGLNSFSTNETIPVGSDCAYPESVSLNPEEQLAAMKIMKKLVEKYPGRITGTSGPIAKLKSFREMVCAKETGKKTADWKMGYLSACGCVFNRIDILHDGTIVPCHMLPSLRIGDIRTHSLKEVWFHDNTLNALRLRRFKAMKDVEDCKGCEWVEFCNGGCPGLSFQLTGNICRANPCDCFRRFLSGIGESYEL